MTTFRQDTSFPFLKVARESGVPYQKVMRIVEVADSHKTTLLPPGDLELTRKVFAAMKAEANRRAMVVEANIKKETINANR